MIIPGKLLLYPVLYSSDFPGVGPATSLPGGFSDDEGILGSRGAHGGAAGGGAARAGGDSPAARSYRLCHHEGQGQYALQMTLQCITRELKERD